MMKLEAVKNNKLILRLEKLSLFLCVVGITVCIYLYGEYHGFIEGSNATTSVLREGFPMISGGKPIFEFVSEGYFYIFTALAVVLGVHLLTDRIFFKFINLILISFAIYGSFQVFSLKNEIFNSEIFNTPYFDMVRQSYYFDIIGIIAIVSFLIIQIILVYLIFKKPSGVK